MPAVRQTFKYSVTFQAFLLSCPTFCRFHAVARPEIQQLRSLLDAAADGVSGLILHGMGGIGKSTMAHQLAVELQAAGCFAGGVFMVAVQPEMTAAADEQTLRHAQKDLLQALTGKAQNEPHTLDEGASQDSSCAQGVQQPYPAPD